MFQWHIYCYHTPTGLLRGFECALKYGGIRCMLSQMIYNIAEIYLPVVFSVIDVTSAP